MAALTRPTNTIEFGFGGVNTNSAKFGEYNGLGHNGAFGIGHLDLEGGGAYDSDSARRWSVRGNNLGLEVGDLTAEYGVQGRFRLSLSIAELLRDQSDSYRTAYLGAGTDTLTLPTTWIKPIVPQVSGTAINYRVLSPTIGTARSLTGDPTAPQLATIQAIQNADGPAFQEYGLKTKRSTYEFAFSYNFNPKWVLTGSYRDESKNGAKPVGMLSTQSGFESVTILPEPIDMTTAQANVGLQYSGKKGFMQAAYFGSLFENNIKSLTRQDPSDLTVFSTQGTAPDNQFHQFSLTGGYRFSQSTRLTMNTSYSRNTQNQTFLTDLSMPLGLARPSFDGLVITRGLNLKLTAHPAKRFTVAASYKFDDRDNRSPVDTYVFYDINIAPIAAASPFNLALGLPAGTLRNNVNLLANRPQSKRLNRFDLDGEYAIGRGNTLSLGYQSENIDRYCNGTWIACSDAGTVDEDTATIAWRTRLTDTISSKLSYAYSKRDAKYNIDAWLALAPMANVVPVGATTSAYGYMLATGLSGWGPIAGFPTTPLTGNAAFFTPNNNIITSTLYGSRNQLAENPLMRRYTLADRNRDKIRSSVTWLPTDKLSIDGSADFNHDDFRNSPLGLQDAKSWTVNFDGSYALSRTLSIGVFYTYEDQLGHQTGWNYVGNAAAAAGTITGGCFATVAAKNVNNKIDPCNAWTGDSHDRADTYGFTLQRKNMLHGKLALDGSVDSSRARTDMAVQGGNYAAIPGTANLVYIPASNLPSVRSDSLELRLTALYTINPTTTVRALYLFRRLDSADFAFDATQPGTMATWMPTYEVSPNYSQHVLGVSYVRTFR